MSWKIRELDGAPEGTPCLHRPFYSLALFSHCLLYGRCIKFYDFHQAGGVNYFLNGCQLDNSQQYVRLFSITFNLWDEGPVSRSITGFGLIGRTLDSYEIIMRIVNMIRRCLSGVNSARQASPAVDARFTKSPPRELSVNCSFAAFACATFFKGRHSIHAP